ncbi:unnamed protein product, partial [Prorocentrum cordatum]
CVLGPTMQTHYVTLRGAVQTVLAKYPRALANHDHLSDKVRAGNFADKLGTLCAH